MIRWDLISLNRNKKIQSLKSKVDKILAQKESRQIYFSDFPSVDSYIKEKFPNVDLSHVKIYMTSKDVMSSAGFNSMGGCYIDLVKTIFLLDEQSLNDYGDQNGEFNKAIFLAAKTRLNVADIFVHEALHAVSSSMVRALKQYQNAEEEFVYGNCVEFYRKNGMTDEEIIKSHFLPFCLNNIMSDRDDLSKIFHKMKIHKNLSVVPWEEDYSSVQFSDFMNKHAEYLAEEVVSLAKSRAMHMIECHEKYGFCSVSAGDVDYDSSIRFRGLKF